MNFNALEFGGYVFTNDPKTKIHSPMGSGEFPQARYDKAAYFKNIELIRDPYGDLKSYLRKKCWNRRRLETANEDSSSKRTGMRRGPDEPVKGVADWKQKN